jgi:hypothetical protein
VKLSTITVRIIDGLSSRPLGSFVLNLIDNLLKIRKELERVSIFNNALSFSKRLRNYEFAEIAFEEEEDLLLDDIIDEAVIDEKILYLIQRSKPDWKYLNGLRKLDYGYTMTFDGILKADKRAFVMKNCELIEIGAEGYKKREIEFKSTEDWVMKNNLFFYIDNNVENFFKSGISIESLKNNKFNSVSGSYYFTDCAKVSLKYTKYLEPTQEFIKEVKNAIESENPVEKFKQITKKYGQFIPEEVILGGRTLYGENIISGCSTENSKEVMNANTERILKDNVSSTFNHVRLVGGIQPDDLRNFNENEWVQSLINYKYWDSIEFRNPVSIFQLLPNDLHRRIIMSVGKRIHYVTTEEFTYYVEEFRKPKIFKFNIPSNISNIIQNKEADCNIFATVSDLSESKDDFFTCQVLYQPDEEQRLMIYCIQKEFKERQCKLKIGWMIIGYCTDFSSILLDSDVQLRVVRNDFASNNRGMSDDVLLNLEYDQSVRKFPVCLGIPVLSKLDSSNDSLVIGHHFSDAQKENKIVVNVHSYCLKKNCYVDLPNFTFYTLIISRCDTNNASGIIPFDYSLLKKPYIDLNDNIAIPKFISLYSIQSTNCGPIFLRQTSRKIKIKTIKCKDRTCFICKNTSLKISRDSIKCAFFDPYTRYLFH